MNSSKLLINEPPLQVLPSLAVALGSLNEAVVLQQVHYWLMHARMARNPRKYRDGSWWVYNTYEEWRENNFPFWSVATIKRTFASLEKKGYLRSAHHGTDINPLDRTKWYTIDYAKLDELSLTMRMAQNEPMEGDINAPSGQNEPLHGVNLISPLAQNEPFDQRDASLYTENTTETTNRKKDAAPNGAGAPPPEKPPTPPKQKTPKDALWEFVLLKLYGITYDGSTVEKTKRGHVNKVVAALSDKTLGATLNEIRAAYDDWELTKPRSAEAWLTMLMTHREKRGTNGNGSTTFATPYGQMSQQEINAAIEATKARLGL